MRDQQRGACDLLIADDPREDELYTDIALPLADVDLDQLVTGDQLAVTAYVVAWRTARSRLMERVLTECPNVTFPPLTVEALDWEAMQAPFSAWMYLDTERNGLALDLIARLRNMLAHSARPLFPSQLATTPDASEPLDAEHARRFFRQVAAVLEGRGSLAVQIVDSFGLNKAELGRLFGVSRQAAAEWLVTDVPGDRKGKASVVISIADLLAHRLKPGRLAGVARRPAAAYGGLSMLEMIAGDSHEELLDSVRASFDFAQTA
jgi:hypothetical protein